MPHTSADPPSDPRCEAALQFLARRINYERARSMPCSEEAFKLDRMRELLRRLGDPQRELPIIHVAGTKGKGSTAAIAAAILSAAGYRTGLFTSPHLDRIEERIAVDGCPCSAEEFAEAIDHVRPAVEAMDAEAGRAEKEPRPAFGDQLPTPNQADASVFPPGPTYFEILTAAALWHFARRKADAVVLEVGLGGRLDSTNVCTPRVSIITSISFDHVRQLGPTLADIAAEKAGIIKPGVPVVSGVCADEPREVVRRIARENGCRLIELGSDFKFTYRPPQHLERGPSPGRIDFQYRPADRGPSELHDAALGLLGRHQAANAALALAAIEQLRRDGWTIPEAAVRRGLAELTWPARVEVVARRPTVVLDAAHNAASIGALADVLAESFSVRRRILLFATTHDKDIDGMFARLVGQFDRAIFTRYLNNPRSIAPESLAQKAVQKWAAGERPQETEPTSRACDVRTARTPAEAWETVRRTANPDDLICITGSFFFAAEMRDQIAARPFPQT